MKYLKAYYFQVIVFLVLLNTCAHNVNAQIVLDINGQNIPAIGSKNILQSIGSLKIYSDTNIVQIDGNPLHLNETGGQIIVGNPSISDTSKLLVAGDATFQGDLRLSSLSGNGSSYLTIEADGSLSRATNNTLLCDDLASCAIENLGNVIPIGKADSSILKWSDTYNIWLPSPDEVNDADYDSTNEIITQLSFGGVGNPFLFITEGTHTQSVNLAPLIQNLSLNDDTLFISGGNSIVLPTNISSTSLPISPTPNATLRYDNGTWLATSNLSNTGTDIQINNGGILCTGVTDSITVSGAGTRMMWIPSKAAFRAGEVAGNHWDLDSIGSYSVAMGRNNKALGASSTATGSRNQALGPHSMVAGSNNKASKNYAIALGGYNIASGSYSTAIGGKNTASKLHSIAMGGENTAAGSHSIAMGGNNVASGSYSTAIGGDNTTSKLHAIAMGGYNTTSGSHSVAMGGYNMVSGSHSTAIGGYNTASGYNSVAVGGYNTASGYYSIAVGGYNTASGYHSMADGGYNTASGYHSMTTGGYNTASGYHSMAIGGYNTASGYRSMAIGGYNTAKGEHSTAIGHYNTAIGSSSTAIGTLNTTLGSYSVAMGRYNNDTSIDSLNWKANDLILTIGDGISTTNRSNCLTIQKNGNLWIQGSLTQNSDRNLKENLTPLTNSLENLQTLNGFTYNWKNRRQMGDRTEIGLIAQDIEKVYPELITEVEGYKAVNYIGLIPVLVEALKEQQAHIQTLENKLNALQTEVAGCCSNTYSSKQQEADIPTLSQNIPNPFNQSSSINYYLPKTTQSARIILTDIEGNTLKTYPLKTQGNGSLQIHKNTLASGTYLYTLWVNQAPIDSKRMVITH